MRGRSVDCIATSYERDPRKCWLYLSVVPTSPHQQMGFSSKQFGPSPLVAAESANPESFVKCKPVFQRNFRKHRKNGSKCKSWIPNRQTIQKPQVLEHRAANFYDMKPLKKFILPQCQSPRFKNNAIRRGKLTPLFLKRSQVLAVCRFINLWSNLGEKHVSTDAKWTSENIAKNESKCKNWVQNRKTIQKPEVLEHRAANFYDMKPLKMLILPQCQSPRLKNNAIRRGNVAPLLLEWLKMLTVCGFINFWSNLGENHVNTDAKWASKNIAKMGRSAKNGYEINKILKNPRF